MAKLLSLLSLILLLTSACKKNGCTDPGANNFNSSAEKDDGSCTYSPTPKSTFTFTHNINGNMFLLDTILYNHPAGQTFSIETLKYFISDITLYDTNGDSVYLNMAHYIDIEDPSTLTYTWNGEVKNGTYNGIGFTFGLNSSKNITGAYTNPPESLMEWPIPMGGGYHYMKMEGKYDSLGTIKSYNTHTGALMGTPYFFSSYFNHPFTVSNNKVDATLLMEIVNWYQNPNLYDFDVFGSSIMGNPAAQSAIQQNGIDVFTLQSIQ